jgi:hypothetical protein
MADLEGYPQGAGKRLTVGSRVRRIRRSSSRGVRAMPNPERCRERSEECKRKADVVTDARDRAKWLKLADDWIALSRIPFQTDPRAHRLEDPLRGLWRPSVSAETKN